MIKKAIGIIAALALFVAGTMLIIGYVRNTENRLVAQEQPTDVLVVSQPVEAGESPEDALRVEEYPARLVGDDWLRPGDTLNGLVATIDLLPGEPLVWSRLGEPQQLETGERTRVPIPEGFSAVTIPVTPDRSFGGLLLPGMKVAVVGSFAIEAETPDGETTSIQTTHALVQKALVIEVQADDPPDTGGGFGFPGSLTAANLPTGGFFVTIAVPIYDIERVVFAAEWGSIWLAQQPDEASTEGARVQTAETIFAQIDPEEPFDSIFDLGTRPSILPFADEAEPSTDEPEGADGQTQSAGSSDDDGASDAESDDS